MRELSIFVDESGSCLLYTSADTSKQDTKDAAAAWKDAVAADSSDAAVETATTKLLDFLEGRPKMCIRDRHELAYRGLAACGIANGIAGRYEMCAEGPSTYLISAGNPICDTARS